MNWRLAHSTDRPRIAIFVSKYDHCLQDFFTATKAASCIAKFP